MFNTCNMLIAITEDKWTPPQTHFWVFEFLLKVDSFFPLNNLMELLDSVVWNNTNNVTDGSGEATGIELRARKHGKAGR